jgi:tetratricopeptide (TPR) repeat protein
MLSGLIRDLIRLPLQARRKKRAQSAFDTGLSLINAQDMAGARLSLHEALSLDAEHALAHRWLGTVLANERDYVGAAEHLEQALALDSGLPGGWMDLGTVYYVQRDLHKAAACYRRVVELEPDFAPAHGNLGVVLRDADRLEEAVVHLQRAHVIDPSAMDVFRNLVNLLVIMDRCEEALTVAQAQAARYPEAYEAQLFLGYAHQKLHDPLTALRCYEVALGMRADDPELYYNRSIVYQDLGRVADAFADYERTLSMRGDFPLARFHRALAWLGEGDYERGWDDYELRKLSTDFPRFESTLPQWDGISLAGRSLLIRREQGLGDEIMFSSMLPQLTAMARECIIECEPRLVTIFRRSFPGAVVYGTTDDGRLPDEVASRSMDVEISAGSLPRFLRRRLSDFPVHQGYLKADPRRVERWRDRLSQLGTGPTIGISWSGGVRKTRRPLRSIPLERWLPILRVPGARFVSLQYTKGAAAEVAAVNDQNGLRVEHWQEAIDDFEETAALLCALDQVVSVCTAVIHLGGALGRPVWVMAPYAPEWRYGFSGDKMPWYPSVKIYRQPAFGEWDPVISSVAAELERLAGRHAG